jgi:hypothetical protein
MFSPSQPPSPIVVHRGSAIPSFEDENGSNVFFLLDSAEFGNDLFQELAAIRSKFAIPIVVVGQPVHDRQLCEEANEITQAGAVYFERPAGTLKIDELAIGLSRELTRTDYRPETVSQPASSPAGSAPEWYREHRFYVEAPFGLSADSLAALLQRMKMSDSEPAKDD